MEIFRGYSCSWASFWVLRRGNTLFYLPPQWPSAPKTDATAQTEDGAAAAAKVRRSILSLGIIDGVVDDSDAAGNDEYDSQGDDGGSTNSLDHHHHHHHRKMKKKVSFGASETKIMTPEGKKKFFSANDLSQNHAASGGPPTPTWTSQIVPRYLKKIVKRKKMTEFPSRS